MSTLNSPSSALPFGHEGCGRVPAGGLHYLVPGLPAKTRCPPVPVRRALVPRRRTMPVASRSAMLRCAGLRR